MKNSNFICLMLLIPAWLGMAQSSQNYVKSYTASKEGLTDLSVVNDKGKVQEAVVYYDGLGRVIQSVQREASPQGYDVVSPVYYDAYGRQQRSYLPFRRSTTNGSYQPIDLDPSTYGPENAQYSFYNTLDDDVADSPFPFAEQVFEPSPLNRINEQGAPGMAWQPLHVSSGGGNTVKMNYLLNEAADQVKIWHYRNDAIVNGGVYGIATLIKTETLDENENKVQEFTDKVGRTLLKRVFLNSTEKADTYYVYGDDDLLYVVFPPELSKTLTTTTPDPTQLTNWAFQYKYDSRKRMIEKQVPGADPVFMVYDNRDRLVLTQDGEQRENQQWIFTKYDALNRPIATGFYTNAATDQEQMQTIIDNFYNEPAREWYEVEGSAVHGYTNKSFPQVSDENAYLSLTYYDNYSYRNDLCSTCTFSSISGFSRTVPQGTYTFPSTEESQVNSLVTMSKTRVLEGDLSGPARWINSVHYYDNYSRLIQLITVNEYLNGETTSSTLYSFAGWVLENRTKQLKTNQPSREIRQQYNYDHMGRIESADHQIFENGVAGDIVRLFENAYNELGELVDKKLHVNSQGVLQSVDYRYNIRGWLKTINLPGNLADINALDEDYFGMEINYNELLNTNSQSPQAAPTETIIANTVDDFSILEQGDFGFQYGYYTSPVTNGIFSTANMSVINNSWKGIGANNTPIVGKKFMHPGPYNVPAVRRYVVGSAGEPLINGQVRIQGKFWDQQTGGGNGSKGFVTVDGVTLFLEWIVEESTEELNYVSFDLVVNVQEGSTIDFGVTSEGNSSYDGRAMQATISAIITPSTSQQFEGQNNGNISAIQWRHYSDQKTQLYTYQYDGMNRLLAAEYSRGSMDLQSWNDISHSGGNTVNNIKYDLNGNILSLNRQSSSLSVEIMDALTYRYEANQLLSVADAAKINGFKDGNTTTDDYQYDKNGNLIQDLNKGITTITYNYLNLPQLITKSDGKSIEYIYDASGIKLQQVVNDTQVKTTDYLGETIYENDIIANIQHPEGRIVKDGSGGWEYQYHLKDHLGNVRTTFTSKPKEIVYTLNYESNSALPDDEALFEELNDVVSLELFDHTDATTTYTKSQRLTGASSSRIGSVLAIPVGKGDMLSAEVYAKYEAVTSTANTGLTALGTMLINALTGSSTIINEFGQTSISNSYTGTNGAIIGTSGFQPDQNGIYGFLNVLFISTDDNVTVDASRFAFDQISSGAQQIGTTTKSPHDLLSIENFEAPSNGIAIIYVSNEQDYQTNIYFDDINLTVNEHPVVQSDDYYPFGLTFNSYQRVTAKKNDFLYNGKELQDELDLNWLDYGARMYMPDIGRWGVIDPLVELMYSETPYHYVHNNPIIFIDPTGMLPKYNWETSEYEDDDGNKIGWQEALAAHGINTNTESGGQENTDNAENDQQGDSIVEKKANLNSKDGGIQIIENLKQVYSYYKNNPKRRVYLEDIVDMESVNFSTGVNGLPTDVREYTINGFKIKFRFIGRLESKGAPFGGGNVPFWKIYQNETNGKWNRKGVTQTRLEWGPVQIYIELAPDANAKETQRHMEAEKYLNAIRKYIMLKPDAEIEKH